VKKALNRRSATAGVDRRSPTRHCAKK